MHQLLVRFTGMVCVLLVLSISARHLGKDDYFNDDELTTGDDKETKPSLLFFQAWLKDGSFPPKKNCDDDSSEEVPLLDQLEADGVQPDVNDSNGSASEIPDGDDAATDVQQASDIAQTEEQILVICIKSDDTDCEEETGDELVEIA